MNNGTNQNESAQNNVPLNNQAPQPENSSNNVNANQPRQQGYPNSAYNGYPMSGMPQYPKSAMPMYPNSGMPMHPMYGYMQPPKKKMSTAKFAAIFVSIVVLVAIAATVLLVFLKKGDAQGSSNAAETENAQQQENVYSSFSSYEKFAVAKSQMTIDGVVYAFPKGMFNVDNVNYVSLKQMAELFGITLITDMENGTVTFSVNNSVFVLTHDDVEGKVTDETGKTSTVPLTRPTIMFSDGDMFVSVKGLTGVFGFKKVDWDDANGCVKIVTDKVKVSAQ